MRIIHHIRISRFLSGAPWALCQMFGTEVSCADDCPHPHLLTSSIACSESADSGKARVDRKN